MTSVDQPLTAPGHKKKRKLFIALTWLAVLALIEIGVRLVDPGAGQPVYPGYPNDLVVPDNHLGHALARNFSGFFPAAQYHEIPVQTNSYGFRDIEWPKNPGAARPRVMVLGDSVAFGSAVRREDRFTEQAAAMLLQQGRPCEMCNCGVTGYNIEQYKTVLQLRGPELKPNLVLVALILNDAEPMEPDDAARIDLHRAAAQGSWWARLRLTSRDYHFDLGQSYAYNFARRTIKTQMWQSAESGARLNQQYNDQTWAKIARVYADGSGVRRLRESLTAMDLFAHDKLNARLAVLVFAYRRQLTKNDPAVSRKIDELLQVLHIPCIDLFDVLLPKAQMDLYVTGDDCHPNIAGHQLAGEATAELLSGLLSGAN